MIRIYISGWWDMVCAIALVPAIVSAGWALNDLWRTYRRDARKDTPND